MTATITGIQSKFIDSVWPEVVPVLKRVVTEETGQTLEALHERLVNREMQLWVIDNYKAVVVTCIHKRPLHNVLWVEYIAGEDMDDWLNSWMSLQEHYARQYNCAAIEFSGRKGWKHFQKKYPEYREILTTFRKDLT